MQHRSALVATLLIVACGDEPTEAPVQLAATVELGAYATPSLSIDPTPGGSGYSLHFTTPDKPTAPEWNLQRRAGAWQNVATTGTYYSLTGVASGTQFRVR